MKNKIVKSINIELAKAKIILFSDMGFDLVLKLRNLKIVNDKNYYKLETDPEYMQCNTYINLGQVQLVYYKNSLKKTGKFLIFE
jgi:hypothetical protein